MAPEVALCPDALPELGSPIEIFYFITDGMLSALYVCNLSSNKGERYDKDCGVRRLTNLTC